MYITTCNNNPTTSWPPALALLVLRCKTLKTIRMHPLNNSPNPDLKTQHPQRHQNRNQPSVQINSPFRRTSIHLYRDVTCEIHWGIHFVAARSQTRSIASEWAQSSRTRCGTLRWSGWMKNRWWDSSLGGFHSTTGTRSTNPRLKFERENLFEARMRGVGVAV